MNGRRQPATGTRKLFKEFCSGSSTKAKSTRTNSRLLLGSPGTIPNRQRARPRWPIRARSGAKSSFAKKKIITSSSVSTKSGCFEYLDNRADAVVPDFRQTELRNAVEKISGDLCISRPKSRLDWGIELPFDKDFVTYVWFDALTNYISFAGYDPSQSTIELSTINFP